MRHHGMIRAFHPILIATILVIGGLAGAAAQATSGAGPAPPGPAPVPHHVYLVGQLRVMQPWIDAVQSSPDRADAYLVVENRGDAPERLVGARTEAAARVGIAAGVTGDAAPGASVIIPPRSTITLKPDEAHLVLRGLHADIRSLDSVPGVLEFERAGPLTVTFATSRDAALQEDQSNPASDTATSLVK